MVMINGAVCHLSMSPWQLAITDNVLNRMMLPRHFQPADNNNNGHHRRHARVNHLLTIACSNNHRNLICDGVYDDNALQ